MARPAEQMKTENSQMHLSLSLPQELLLAEKWAKMNKLPFPKIDPYVFDREGLKECYVFKPKNPDVEKDCPTIIHFVLANINFRKYKAPGTLGMSHSLQNRKLVKEQDWY